MTVMSDEPIGFDPDDPTGPAPPKMALWLGYAGLIPFAALTLAIILFRQDPFVQEPAGMALLAYGAIILSFLGGVHWGRALYEPDSRLQMRDFVLSVLPSLYGWGCLFLPLASAGVLLLMPGFIWQLSFDLKAMRLGILPRWFGRLRIWLTTGATLSLLISGVALL
jgi:hypothetical protein